MGVELIIGCLLLALGLYTCIERRRAPHRFAKLDAMQKKWGKQRGQLLHAFAYTALPLVCGGLMVFAALR